MPCGVGETAAHPRSVSTSRWLSRSISKILTVLSEEQVCSDPSARLLGVYVCSGTVVYREAFPVIVQLAVMLHRLGVSTLVERGGAWAGSRSNPRGDLTFASAFTRSGTSGRDATRAGQTMIVGSCRRRVVGRSVSGGEFENGIAGTTGSWTSCTVLTKSLGLGLRSLPGALPLSRTVNSKSVSQLHRQAALLVVVRLYFLLGSTVLSRAGKRKKKNQNQNQNQNRGSERNSSCTATTSHLHQNVTTMATNSIKLLTGNSHPELAKRVSER